MLNWLLGIIILLILFIVIHNIDYSNYHHVAKYNTFKTDSGSKVTYILYRIKETI